MHLTNQQQLRLGAFLWVLSLQYYVVQVIVAAMWPVNNGYSWANNTISDLANTVCGAYGDRLVCSPGYASMNISFVWLGITMIAGAVLLNQQLGKTRPVQLGFWFMALAGIGTILVGLYPENTVASLHILGAAIPFVLGNVGMILISERAPGLPTWLRVFGIVLGSVALLALALFLAQLYLGIGIGGMERVVAYPQSVWMITFGGYLLFRKKPTTGQ